MGVFKDANVRIAFKANSTINNDLQNCEQCNQYENSGNYQLLSHNCGDMLASARMLHLDNMFCRTHIRLNSLNKHILMQDMLMRKITMLCIQYKSREGGEGMFGEHACSLESKE